MRSVLGLLIWVLLCVPVQAQTNVVFPEGTSFGIIPFKGSVPAEDFSGFIDPETSTSVMITELPAEAADQIMDAFQNPASLAQQGMTASSFTEITVSGRPALQMKGTQQTQGLGPFPKCLVVVKDAAVTGIITAQMPLAKEGDACLLLEGLTLRAPASLDEKIAALPFRVTALGDMRIQDVLAGSALLLARGPDPKTGPIMIIAQSISQQQSITSDKDRMTVSAHMLAGVTNVRQISIESEKTLRIDGRPATELIASGMATPQNRPVRLVQWVRFEKDGSTLRLYGESDRASFDDSLPSFIHVRDGLRAD